jgi:hypothetical protein
MTEQKNPIGDMSIDLTFTVDQVNELLHTLAHLPFHQSAPIMKMIQDQAIPQAQKHEEAVKNVADVIEKAKVTEEV